jgi:hypothetical protein
VWRAHTRLSHRLCIHVERRRSKHDVTVAKRLCKPRLVCRRRASDGGVGVDAAVGNGPRHAVEVQRAYPAVHLVSQSVAIAGPVHLSSDAG